MLSSPPKGVDPQVVMYLVTQGCAGYFTSCWVCGLDWEEDKCCVSKEERFLMSELCQRKEWTLSLGAPTSVPNKKILLP